MNIDIKEQSQLTSLLSAERAESVNTILLTPTEPKVLFIGDKKID